MPAAELDGPLGALVHEGLPGPWNCVWGSSCGLACTHILVYTNTRQLVSCPFPRPWIPRLYKKLSRRRKAKLGLSSAGVTTRKRHANGKVTVP